MRNTVRMLAAVGTVVAATAAGSPTATADGASTAPSSPYAPSVMVLTVGRGEDAAYTTVDRAVMLRCSPTAAGDHPAPEEACAALEGAEGDLTAVMGDPETACTAIHAPVVVTAQGIWRGQPVSYEETFANACVMDREKGVVFSF